MHARILTRTCVLCLMLMGAARADTLYVPSAQYPTIQSAINAAQSGDEVVVAAGTYFENIFLLPYKPITVRSSDPTDPAVVAATIIDGRGINSVARFNVSDATLSGFTLTNGAANIGGGIYVAKGSAAISHCIITGNTAAQRGGGIYVDGQMWVDGEYVTITNCLIVENEAVGGDAGGIMIATNAEGVEIRGCTIARNIAGGNSAGLYVISYSRSGLMTNSIVWGNTGSSGQSNIIGFQFNVRYSDVQAILHTGTGNIEEDPLFVDPDNGDYRLSADSPVIDAGDPISIPSLDGEVDLDGLPRNIDGEGNGTATIDMGVYEFLPAVCLDPGGSGDDCNNNDVLDECEPDCDANGVTDSCDIADGTSEDCNVNGVPDSCDLDNLTSADCNENNLPDECDIADGTSEDLNADGVPDECQTDCNGDGIPDDHEDDLNDNGIPDVCEPNRIWYVDQNNCRYQAEGTEEDPFCKIDKAVDASITNDEIVVADGVYQGGYHASSFDGRDLYIHSLNGPQNCIVTGRYGFILRDTQTSASIIEGFTITGCTQTAILCEKGSSVQIRNCIITGNADGICANRGDNCGSGLFETSGNPAITGTVTVSDCVITGNSGAERATGIYVARMTVKVFDTVISDNVTFPSLFAGGAQGGGIYLKNSFGSEIHNCTITNNRVLQDWFGPGLGGGIYGIGSTVEISNSIVWGNFAETMGSSIFAAGSAVTVQYSDIQDGFSGTGNIIADPLFVEDGYWEDNGTPEDLYDDIPVEGDYHLRLDSPCVDLGDPDFIPDEGQTDIDGDPRVIDGRVDMGADESDPDCNQNGVHDLQDIAEGTSGDCNENTFPDECEEPDCNGNLVPDECDIASGASLDCNENGVPDECEADCNTNGVQDDCDIAEGTSRDCNENGVPDECDSLEDCNENGILDSCDIVDGTSTDLNFNGIPDECDPNSVQWFEAVPLNAAASVLQQGSDSQYLILGCNTSMGIACEWDVASWIDVDGLFSWATDLIAAAELVPEELFIVGEPEQYSIFWSFGSGTINNDDGALLLGWNGYRYPPPFPGIYNVINFTLSEAPISPNADAIVIDAVVGGFGTYSEPGGALFAIGGSDMLFVQPGTLLGTAIEIVNSIDCNSNGVPDDQDITNCDGSPWCLDCNDNDIPDECDLADCDGSPWCDDCNGNDVPDECDIVQAQPWGVPSSFSEDCNDNLIPDECDIANGTSEDCTGNAIPDECEPDCNHNGIADSCDIADCDGRPWCDDCNDNGIPDECDLYDSGNSKDCNGNGIPDECEDIPCPICDLNGDGIVDRTDLGIMRRCLGYSDPTNEVECEVADLDGDGEVTMRDWKLFIKCYDSYSGSIGPIQPAAINNRWPKG